MTLTSEELPQTEKKLKILVTNDDGYNAKGIATLVKILQQFGELTVVAPKSAQSGMSMAVSMGFRPLGVKHLGLQEGVDWWYLDGTPASCIKFGIDNVLYPQKPDLVISGINHGSNAATAALYSGTIGAVMEGTVNGIQSIGFSLDYFGSDADFSIAEKFLPEVLQILFPLLGKKKGRFFNVNFPNISPDQVKGIRFCSLGSVHWEKEYRDFFDYLSSIGREPEEADLQYIAKAEENGEDIYVMAGDCVSNDDNPSDADHILLSQGYITITPQNIDNCDIE